MDSRQSMSMMGPPGYPHMPPMSSTGPPMTGDRETTPSTQLWTRSHPPLFPPQDIMHRWTSSTWYLLETSRCIACQPMTSRMILIGTPSSSPSKSFRNKKVKVEELEARGRQAEMTGCSRTGRRSPLQKNVQCVLEKDAFQSPDIFTKENHNERDFEDNHCISGTCGHRVWLRPCLGTGRTHSVEPTRSSAVLSRPAAFHFDPPAPRSLTLIWFEQHVQLVILLLLTLASAASWMSLSLICL